MLEEVLFDISGGRCLDQCRVIDIDQDGAQGIRRAQVTQSLDTVDDVDIYPVFRLNSFPENLRDAERESESKGTRSES
jgi:hypothetical protein